MIVSTKRWWRTVPCPNELWLRTHRLYQLGGFPAIYKMNNETPRNAKELIGILCFFHYGRISEEIFEQAWENRSRNVSKGIDNLLYTSTTSCQKADTGWDPTASYSLIMYDASDHPMSMHPLVETWARDRLTEGSQNHCWAVASSTLSSINSEDYKRLTRWWPADLLMPQIE